MGNVRLGKETFCDQAKGIIDSVLGILNRVINQPFPDWGGDCEDNENQFEFDDDACFGADPALIELSPLQLDHSAIEDELLEDSPRALGESQNKVREILESIKDTILSLPLSNGHPVIPWLPALPVEVTRNLAKRCGLKNAKEPKQVFFIEPMRNEADDLEKEARRALLKIRLERELIEDLRQEYIEMIADRRFLRESVGYCMG